MPTADLLPRLDKQLQLRVSAHELRELNVLVRRLGIPRSAIVRAAIRAVVEDPRLVWGGPLYATGDAEPEPERDPRQHGQLRPEPSVPPKQGKRRRRR